MLAHLMKELLFWVSLFAFVSAWLLTAAMRRYALARNVVDAPNARSSHTRPTPRGGGMSFVLSYLAGVAWLAHAGGISAALAWASAGAGAWVAVVGWIDDHRHVPARWRLLAHALGAAWMVHWLGVPALAGAAAGIMPAWAAGLLAVLFLCWLLNLYNFMDGIDGLASMEAISVAVAGGWLSWQAGAHETAVLAGLLAVAVLGFLPWNFPRARIFMGDGGSGFLGLVLGGLCLHAAAADFRLFWAWLILLGVFVVDASYTLARRMVRGDPVHQAHRTHGYQYAARRWASHSKVTIAALAINVGWLLPWAAAAAAGRIDGAAAMAAAYAPLLVLAWRLKAGLPEPRPA